MLEKSAILNASILIVDDQEANVLLLEQVLRNAGYTHISSTMDPREVCPLHRAHRYDLILLDLKMPGMDGFEVMEGLKEIEAGGYLPVLVVTAQPGHKLRALQAGARDFVSKPFDLVEVQTRIYNMLEVRLLYKRLDNYSKELEQAVQERTAELRASEARFRNFTELSSDWYWEQDEKGNFTFVSGPTLEMLGIEKDHLTDGHGIAEIGKWNEAERAVLDANIAARKPFIDLVFSRSNAHGVKQYLQVSGEPMFDAASRFVGYRGVGADITDRVRPYRAQTLFRNAMDVVDKGIFLLDRAAMCLIDANEAMCRMSGYSRQELLSLDLAGLGIGERQAAVFDALLAGSPTQIQDLELRRKDGSALSTTIDWSALRSGDGIIVGMVSAIGKRTD